MRLHKTYNKARLDKHLLKFFLSRMVWNRDALASLLFNFALEHAIRKVKVSKKAPKPKGDTIYADISW